MFRDKPLSEKSFKIKRIAYLAISVTWVIIGAVMIIYKHNTEGGFVAIAISTIFHARMDSLNENYSLYKKLSEPVN